MINEEINSIWSSEVIEKIDAFTIPLTVFVLFFLNLFSHLYSSVYVTKLIKAVA